MFKKKKFYLLIVLSLILLVVGCSSSDSNDYIDESAHGLKVVIDMPSELLSDVNILTIGENITINKAEIGLYHNEEYKETKVIEDFSNQTSEEHNSKVFGNLKIGEQYTVKAKLIGSINGEEEEKKLYGGEKTSPEITADSVTAVRVNAKPLSAESVKVNVESNIEIESIILKHNFKGYEEVRNYNGENEIFFENTELDFELVPAIWSVIVEVGLNDDLQRGKEVLLLPTEEKVVDIIIEEEQNIISVEGLANREVEYGTDISEINLPDKVDVTLETGLKADIDVVWNTDSYEAEVAGEQSITGDLINLPDDIVNPDGLQAEVTIIVDEGYGEIDGEIIVDGSIDPPTNLRTENDNLVWDEPDNDNIAGYNIYKSETDSPDDVGLPIATVEDNSYSNLEEDYYYWVRAYNSDGYSSGLSKAIYYKVEEFLEPLEQWTFEGHSAYVTSVAVDSNGYVYSGSRDKTVRKISPNGEEVWIFDGHNDYVRSVAVDSDGYVYSGSSDGTIRKISPEGEQQWVFEGYSDSIYYHGIYSVAVDINGYVYSGSRNSTIRKISPDGEEQWVFDEHSSIIHDIVVDSDGYIYSGSSADKIRKISPEGEQQWVFEGHSDTVRSVAVDSNGYVYSGSRDKTVRKISPNGEEVWIFDGHSNDVISLAVDSDGYFYSSIWFGPIKKISPNRKEIWTFDGHSSNVYALAVDEDGYVYSGSWDNTVRKIAQE